MENQQQLTAQQFELVIFNQYKDIFDKTALYTLFEMILSQVNDPNDLINHVFNSTCIISREIIKNHFKINESVPEDKKTEFEKVIANVESNLNKWLERFRIKVEPKKIITPV